MTVKFQQKAQLASAAANLCFTHPVFAGKPSKPFSKTQGGRVLSFLLTGACLTRRSAVHHLDIYALPSVISRLRNIVKIEDKWVRQKNLFGQWVRMKQYWMTPEAISQIKALVFIP